MSYCFLMVIEIQKKKLLNTKVEKEGNIVIN